MGKKPSLSTSKDKRLRDAQRELSQESLDKNSSMKQTTVIIEADLLYAAKEIAIKRKREGIEPSSITGMVREALREIVNKHINT